MVAGVLEVEGPGHAEMAGYGRSETCPTLAELALPAPALSSRGGKDRWGTWDRSERGEPGLGFGRQAGRIVGGGDDTLEDFRSRRSNELELAKFDRPQQFGLHLTAHGCGISHGGWMIQGGPIRRSQEAILVRPAAVMGGDPHQHHPTTIPGGVGKNQTTVKRLPAGF